MSKWYIEAYKLMEYANNQKDKTVDANDIARFPYADVVERSAYDQVRWERDTAIAQLAEIGKGLGEKMDDVVERKKGKWNFIGDNMFECTSCGVAYTTKQLEGLRNYNKDPDFPRFCPCCGSFNGEKNDNG